jgi:ketosteroid isomerase-like protein
MLPAPDDAIPAAATRNGAANADAEAWVAEFIDGWRAPRDADSFCDHFDPILADDVRMVQPQLPTAVGRRAFREDFARPVFGLIPDLHADVHRWAARGDMILIEFTLSGTLAGRPVSWDAVDRVTLRDGLAIERRSYFDPLTLLGAVATRPRAWPAFARAQLKQIRNRLRGAAR